MNAALEAAGARAPMDALEHRGLFGMLYRSNLVYNQCWEDPAVDREALGLGAGDRVVVITSAGCNVLDYALVGGSVLAVDANPRQNHLLELKRAGIRTLDHGAFFSLFGRGGSRQARDLYADMRGQLSEPARRYWDRSIDWFDPRRARGGSFYYCGTSGLFALAVRRVLELSGLRRVVDLILNAGSLEEQQRIYRDQLRMRLGDRLLRVVGSAGVLSLLGVPEAQRRLVGTHPGGIVGYLRACLDHVLSVSLLRDNYFWAVYLNGGYDLAACPEYLRRDNFDRLRAGLIDNIRIQTATMASALATADERFNAFVLLDHMDWLAREPQLIEEEWGLIQVRASHGARIIFRSGATDASFLPPHVRERLVFDHERARRLHSRCRVGTYGSFHIARVA